MRSLLIATLVLASTGALANRIGMKDIKGLPLDKQKQMLTSDVNQKLESLQSYKDCVSNAQNERTLTQCGEDKKEAMEDMHEAKEKMIEQKEEVLEKEKDQVDKMND